jgi:outer membrane receptor protein involved in Fe transport
MFGVSGNLRIQHNSVGESYNQLTGGFPSYKLSQGDYQVTDAIFSLETDGWSARIYVNNIADTRGISYEDTQDFDQIWGRNSSSVIRPRNFGVSFRKYF